MPATRGRAASEIGGFLSVLMPACVAAPLAMPTVSSFSKRFGRIILSEPFVGDVAYNDDYSFKTLQASGIQIPFLVITKRDVQDRLEAVNKLRKLVAPNYIITTARNYSQGKIWALYLNQKTVANYNMRRTKVLRYTSDTDVYTRVVVYGKNKAPTNLMLEEGVTFVTPDQAYSGQAVESELSFNREQGDFLLYESTLTAAGRILNKPRPTVFINGVPINGDVVELLNQQVRVMQTQTITTEQGK